MNSRPIDSPHEGYACCPSPLKVLNSRLRCTAISRTQSTFSHTSSTLSSDSMRQPQHYLEVDATKMCPNARPPLQARPSLGEILHFLILTETRKSASISGNLQYCPRPLAVSHLHQLAQKSCRGIENRFALEGCDARSRYVYRNMPDTVALQNLFRIKVQTDDRLGLATYQNFQGIEWCYHIATAAYGDDQQIYVMDPLFSNTGIKFPQWINSITVDSDVNLTIYHGDHNDGTRLSNDPFASTQHTDKKQFEKNRQELNALKPLSRNYFRLWESGIHSALTARNHRPFPNFAYPLGPQGREKGLYISFHPAVTQAFKELKFSFNALQFTRRAFPFKTQALFLKDKETPMTLEEVQNEMNRRQLLRIQIMDIPIRFGDNSSYMVL